MQCHNGIILPFGIFGMIWIEFVVSNHPAVHWQQVGDTAAAWGLDRSREFKEYLARQKKRLLRPGNTETGNEAMHIGFAEVAIRHPAKLRVTVPCSAAKYPE